MTAEERYIEQGRARDSAKKLKAELATLRAYFQQYTELLASVQNAIAKFLEDPSAKVGDDRPVIDNLYMLQRKISEPGFFHRIAEFADKTRQLHQLEEHIKDFR